MVMVLRFVRVALARRVAGLELFRDDALGAVPADGCKRFALPRRVGHPPVLGLQAKRRPRRQPGEAWGRRRPPGCASGLVLGATKFGVRRYWTTRAASASASCATQTQPALRRRRRAGRGQRRRTRATSRRGGR